MGYVASPTRINISSKTFYTLKCDENCFSMNKSNANINRISDTLINTIVQNMDISDIKEDPVTTYNTCRYNKKFNSKLNKAIDSKLDKYRVLNKGIYVSRLLEIYAEKAYYERELIYYAKYIEKIKDVSARGNLLSIRYRDNEKFNLIYPFDIRTDEWSSYNYLIGTDITDANTAEEGKLINMRIAYISECEPVTYKPKFPKCKFSPREIEERIVASGVQFVSAEPEEIKVRLPAGKGKGKDMYDHMVFMRPPISEMPSSSEPDVYTFKCTVTQARYYFFKFGAEIEIIKPESLRQAFFDAYKAAYHLYEDSTNP